MKTPKMKHLCLAMGLISISSLGHASGFALIEQSASGLGNAYAGAAASAEDASTIFFNPAGMTKLPGRQVVVALHGIKPSAKYSDGNGATPDGGDAGGLALVPNFYYTMPLGPATRFGISVNSPFGLKTEYDLGWVGQFAAIKSEVKTIDVNPSLAAQLTDKLSVGLGININYIKAELSNMTPALYSGATAGLGTVEGDDWGFGINAGLLYDIDDATRLGMSYRSRISHKLEGNATFVGSPVANTPVTAEVTLPDTFSFSLMHQVSPELKLLSDISYTTWSTFEELRVLRPNGTTLTVTPENWDDTWRFSLGATYQLNSALKLRGGLAYDQSPVPNAYRTPRIPDNDRTWVAVGIGYQASQNGTVDAGYTHLFVKDAAQPASAAIPAGTYKSSVDILSVQYTHTF